MNISHLWLHNTIPRWSMYGIFGYICPINDPNVGKYTIHGSSGICKVTQYSLTAMSAQRRLLWRSWESQMTVLLPNNDLPFFKRNPDLCHFSNIFLQHPQYFGWIPCLLLQSARNHVKSSLNPLFFTVKSQLSWASFIIFDHAPSFSTMFPPCSIMFDHFPSSFHMSSTIFPAFSHPISSIWPQPGAFGGQDHPAAPGRVGQGR